MRHRYLNIGLWIIGALLLLGYRSFFSFDQRWTTTQVLVGIDLIALLTCSIVVNRWLVPALLHQKRTLLFAGALTVTAFVAVNLLQLLQGLVYHYLTKLSEQEWAAIHLTSFQIFNSWLVVVLGLACIFAVRSYTDYRKSSRRNWELQQEKIQTELLFLKAQINPHFLFNSINSIYAHIDKSNRQARDIVLQFSQMLRYQLYECNTDRIAIEKELAYLKSYVALQKLRLNENISVQFEVGADMTGFSVAPLMFVPFVENAFKYLSAHDKEDNLIKIDIRRESGALVFHCFNTKDRYSVRDLREEGGIGIGNVKRRLELVYPGAHSVEITDTESSFEVTVRIHLKQQNFSA